VFLATRGCKEKVSSRMFFMYFAASLGTFIVLCIFEGLPSVDNHEISLRIMFSLEKTLCVSYFFPSFGFILFVYSGRTIPLLFLHFCFPLVICNSKFIQQSSCNLSWFHQSTIVCLMNLDRLMELAHLHFALLLLWQKLLVLFYSNGIFFSPVSRGTAHWDQNGMLISDLLILGRFWDIPEMY